jgi:hypothetical protein
VCLKYRETGVYIQRVSGSVAASFYLIDLSALLETVSLVEKWVIHFNVKTS